mmetsp:Transcript_9816/g.19335  ORF Transcript_9816/g.19335 Transcript_9816/m.19335 type:complete len:249 (-) Transcript_9816:1170-1916(-)
MIIYGGVNSNGKLLDDLQILNVGDPMHWLMPKVSADQGKPGKLAYFTMTAVYPITVRTQSNFDIFHIPYSQDEFINHKNSGIYMFGGIDRNGKVKNDVYVLRIKRFKGHADGLFRWTLLSPVGQAPIARYAHTATLVTKYLIVIGGRSNTLTKYGGYDVTEVAALNIENCRWEIVKVNGHYPGGRWGAVCCCLGSSVLYYGGMRLERYSKSKMFIMETDTYNVGILIAREAEAISHQQSPLLHRKHKL